MCSDSSPNPATRINNCSRFLSDNFFVCTWTTLSYIGVLLALTPFYLLSSIRQDDLSLSPILLQLQYLSVLPSLIQIIKISLYISIDIFFCNVPPHKLCKLLLFWAYVREFSCKFSGSDFSRCFEFTVRVRFETLARLCVIGHNLPTASAGKGKWHSRNTHKD